MEKPIMQKWIMALKRKYEIIMAKIKMVKLSMSK